MFVASPSTMRTRVAGALGERRLVGRVARRCASASRSTSRRNACGVCARKIVSRDRASRCTTRPRPARLLHRVARRDARRAPRPTRRPPQSSARSDRRSRTAARRRESRSTSLRVGDGAERGRHRILPPRAAGDDAQRLGRVRSGTPADRPARSGGSATTTSSTAGCVRNAVTLRSRIVWPPIDSSCLGWPAPSRSPRPPAAMIAVTYIFGIIEGSRGSRFTVHGSRFKFRSGEPTRSGRRETGRAPRLRRGCRRERCLSSGANGWTSTVNVFARCIEKPDGDDPAADDDDGREPALVSVDALVEARLDQVVLRGVREQERVERRQQPRPAIELSRRPGRRDRAAGSNAVLAVHARPVRRAPRAARTRGFVHARVQPRPLREVAVRRRTERRQKARRQLDARLVRHPPAFCFGSH